MKLGLIIETKEYEKVWNAFRFANTAIKAKHEIKIFLMGEAVEIETLVHEKYNIAEQIKLFNDYGGEILTCGTCLKSRNLSGSEICPLSTMNDCLKMVEWADKILTF
jgi:sulfur relay (sulfurtransferase) complex TusBCD TusD component (DsrE family)